MVSESQVEKFFKCEVAVTDAFVILRNVRDFPVAWCAVRKGDHRPRERHRPDSPSLASAARRGTVRPSLRGPF